MPTQHNIQSKLVDLPEVRETFGDAVRSVWFDGNWRIEVDVTRLDNRKDPADKMTTSQYPACRLVLSATAGIALLDKLAELAKELEANGTLRRNPLPAGPGVTH